MDSIRLLLVDDHILFRESLGRMLDAEPDFDVVGDCGEAAEALQVLARTPVDLVLLDFDLKGMSGAQVIAAARESGYGGKFLMVTAGMETIDMVETLQLGISGIFLKHNSAGNLVRAIRQAASGGVWLDRKMVELLASRIPTPGERNFHASLTEREQQVLRGIMQGLTNRKIAEILAISEGAVKFALQQLFEKTGVRSRAQLVRVALQGTAGEL
jgi:DNA-binding NarL/FixJ family response regulator